MLKSEGEDVKGQSLSPEFINDVHGASHVDRGGWPKKSSSRHETER